MIFFECSMILLWNLMTCGMFNHKSTNYSNILSIISYMLKSVDLCCNGRRFTRSWKLLFAEGFFLIISFFQLDLQSSLLLNLVMLIASREVCFESIIHITTKRLFNTKKEFKYFFSLNLRSLKKKIRNPFRNPLKHFHSHENISYDSRYFIVFQEPKKKQRE